MARRKRSSKRKPLKVRSNGRLRRAAGVKKGKMTRAKAQKVKRTGTPAQRRSANFYLNVLSGRRRRKK